ncbi:response regulator [Nisaea acidiphila]|uniref:Response regulator n=1 Tax=Nisaea acidiphila TaxID=1862145 RepID=A0A9J7AXS9_9PROT|nr:response regulator [Nisaea acidiphila]UUX51610.1 response regulator [Nisaea acidiphila]
MEQSQSNVHHRNDTVEQVILVVDDEPEICDYVETVAEEMGIAAVTSVTAKQFMQLYGTTRPAGIVMDIVMPDMDGIELVQWLGEQGHGIPVLLMSGYTPTYADSLVDIAKGCGVRISGRLTKPFAIDDLEAALTALVRPQVSDAQPGTGASDT